MHSRDDDGPTGRDEIARDHDGRPLTDRYGRPVRCRTPMPAPRSDQQLSGRHAGREPGRPLVGRQQLPPADSPRRAAPGAARYTPQAPAGEGPDRAARRPSGAGGVSGASREELPAPKPPQYVRRDNAPRWNPGDGRRRSHGDLPGAGSGAGAAAGPIPGVAPRPARGPVGASGGSPVRAERPLDGVSFGGAYRPGARRGDVPPRPGAGASSPYGAGERPRPPYPRRDPAAGRSAGHSAGRSAGHSAGHAAGAAAGGVAGAAGIGAASAYSRRERYPERPLGALAPQPGTPQPAPPRSRHLGPAADRRPGSTSQRRPVAPGAGGPGRAAGPRRTGTAVASRVLRAAGRTTRPGGLLRRIGPVKILGFLLAAVVALVLGAGLWVDGSLHRTDALVNYDGRPGNTSGTNWLLVGTDSRAGLSRQDADRLTAGELDDSTGRTDTIMVVHIPSGGGKARVVSFPRDSWVDIPGEGKNKINQAFAAGGPPLLQRTIEQATGLRIDHYAEIGFGGFANVVDAVGGITMCLDQPLVDPMAGINLQADCQQMNGPTALGYVRSRYTSANGDLDRVQRQRAFLSALSDKITSPGTLLNPFRALPVTKTLAGAVTVNNGDHVWNLARLALAMSNSPQQDTVPIASFVDTYAGNAAVWDEPAAQKLFEEMR